MRASSFDDHQSIQGHFRDLAEIRLQNVETAQESIRGIDVTELAGACGHRLIASQGRERFIAV
jgi:hypothetical protein